ncbi:MAG: DUF47 domain-containing protein [Bacteroidetes bacterium]|nr:DUF47 domain-containing protein [Bacteroidota bacterium]
MSLNSLLKIFTPKNKIFYELFEQVVGNVAILSDKLRALVAESDFDKRAAMITQMEDLEHANDDLTHSIFTELGRNFITPFDREDIHYLATSLDDIADYIYAAAKKINFYRVNPSDIGFQKLAEVIQMSAQELKSAVHQLRDMKNMKSITESLVRVNSYENQADDLFDMSIERLFETEPDAKEVIKKREIFQTMENATDKCEDAANVIESIIIKYA